MTLTQSVVGHRNGVCGDVDTGDALRVQNLLYERQRVTDTAAKVDDGPSSEALLFQAACKPTQSAFSEVARVFTRDADAALQGFFVVLE